MHDFQTIELLKDKKGLYGFRINPEAFIDKKYELGGGIIYRKDILAEGYLGNTGGELVLHAIPKKFNFMKDSLEYRIYDKLRQILLYNRGADPIEASLKKKEDARIRKLYHAQKGNSRRVVNNAIRRCLDECADPNALRIARRYHKRYRALVYYLCCQSDRVAQLFESFPVLAFAIYLSGDFISQIVDMSRMITEGKKLKDIAKATGVSMVCKKIRPQHAYLGYLNHSFFATYPFLVHDHMPKNTLEQGRWLNILRYVNNRNASQDHIQWFLKNTPTNIKKSLVQDLVTDLSDWMRVSGYAGYEGKKFKENMSFTTIKELCEEWHARREIFNGVEPASLQFPEPWLPKHEKGALSIEPILNGIALYKEGKEMHHCVYSYGSRIVDGRCYIYSICKKGKKVATLELIRSKDADGKFIYNMGQLRAHANKNPSNEIRNLVNQWLKKHNPPPKPIPQPYYSIGTATTTTGYTIANSSTTTNNIIWYPVSSIITNTLV